MSDVWRDMQCDLSGDLSILVDRFRDLFGVASYKELLVLDCRKGLFQRTLPRQQSVSPVGDRHDDNVRWQWRECVQTLYQESVSEECSGNPSGDPSTGKVDTSVSGFCNRILNGDCLEFLSEIPDDSIDYVFVDPPYNLGKNYTGYSDDLESKKYFDWCDKWISELGRVLKPGRMLTLLNIPLYSIRHFQFMKKVLLFQNWIAWDALAFPVRRIMPAHYSILAFSKGQSRELPGLTEEFDPIPIQGIPGSFDCLEPMGEGYCNRSICIARRRDVGISDRGPLTDLWWDIHRLKHNTRRVDHPTQLPPHLLYRLIAIFTRPQEIVLDCFNGAGTTTLAAHRMGRCYVGIEKSKDYCDIAQNRHKEILRGIDPFRKANRILRAKNSPVPRLPKQKYEVPKKTLQMEVKRIAEELGHLPNREELAGHGRFPIRYYDEYFVSWGEVCAAARTTGMTEEQPSFKGTSSSRPEIQMMLDFDIRGSGE